MRGRIGKAFIMNVVRLNKSWPVESSQNSFNVRAPRSFVVTTEALGQTRQSLECLSTLRQ